MRIPFPNNRLVAFTLAGALLTAIVAGALAAPIDGLSQSDGQATRSVSTVSDGPQRVAADAPTPNQEFTPAVQTQSEYEGEEHEADEEEYGEDGEVGEDGEDEEHGEDGEREEHEEHEEEE